MNWLTVLKLLLEFAGKLIVYLQERKLLEAGEAKALKEQNDQSHEIIARIQARKDAAREQLPTDPDELRDAKDPYRRD